MKKKDTKFFSWLNNAIFWKNYNIMKTDNDTKRIIQAEDNGIKQHGLKKYTTNRAMRRARG